MTKSLTLALACFSAAAAWPWLASAIAGALTSPLARMTRDAWCGMPFHSGALLAGHCPACWAGSALLMATGIMLLGGNRAVRAH